MSALTLFSVTDPQTPVWHSTDAKAIQDQLNAKGVRFERWQADRDLGANPSPETVIAAYQHAIDKLVAEKGYQSWDVISLRADNPQKEALREKFLNEHTHGEDEVRFFVEGAGLFLPAHWRRGVPGAVRKERSDFGSRPHSALV
ncbi:1,2-dihydroxy-3-keto-5-methylthiopentene dioxygenase [Klebsiella pneumoniae]|uniref:1,2-dihydroxy-3-keto-5-methylthiopentene dioxygenase n=1 Tax=Klebsiella pneumoniae TaxID=573 RepID=A0A3S4HZ49_KLEPN|nr:1,2-dihydroxy-3-keto-5-methylthiopentene dioxygenase [Klebsiella pneumoniae]